jgi:hypothetical protein
MKYAGPEASPELQRFMLDKELQDAQGEATQGHGIGWQTAAQWQKMADMLKQFGALKGSVDVSQVFSTKILEMAR